jgi:hypothetical protein
MATVGGIAALVALIALYSAYASWLTKGIQPRQFRTGVPAHVVRDLFNQKVARSGWTVVDDGNPMVAQSPLLTGIRQQIALQATPQEDGSVLVRVGPQRWVTSWGVPKKAHTIRMRLDSFVGAVRALDPSVTPQLTPLRGR